MKLAFLSLIALAVVGVNTQFTMQYVWVNGIALHTAQSYPGAQFYIGCAQVNISGGGSASPPKIALPGAYITVNTYNNLQSYTAPGGASWSG
ncbi:hypothetical protein EUX98_g5051 [Antrodiella citrinella]|uniref:AA9 family lytic polysaccharide monooxygenase n=1 Tax=Antrodiella citrinella TaxID=2447956 RepID=A0A4S4MSQ2_9APHY|nr:hypothetical protein EUX98_g5051 [Antrodiella citrinella]